MIRRPPRFDPFPYTAPFRTMGNYPAGFMGALGASIDGIAGHDSIGARALLGQLKTATRALNERPFSGAETRAQSITASSVSGVQNSADALPKTQPARPEYRICVGDSNIALRVMIYRGYVSQLRPLVILNSIEYAMPPSIEFCELMWANGFQVIFVERPSFIASILNSLLRTTRKWRRGS